MASAEPCKRRWADIDSESDEDGSLVRGETCMTSSTGISSDFARSEEVDNCEEIAVCGAATRLESSQTFERFESSQTHVPLPASTFSMVSPHWIMPNSAVQISKQKAGSLFVQKVFEECDRCVVVVLVHGFHGSVRDLSLSPHGNHVIQKAIQVLPSVDTSFIPDEISKEGASLTVACDKFGCRVLCRLIEHSISERSSKFFDELLQECTSLIQSAYGHYVIEHILEHGTAEQKHQIFLALRSDLVANAQHRPAMFVVAKALDHCSDTDCFQLLKGLRFVQRHSWLGRCMVDARARLRREA